MPRVDQYHRVMDVVLGAEGISRYHRPIDSRLRLWCDASVCRGRSRRIVSVLSIEGVFMRTTTKLGMTIAVLALAVGTVTAAAEPTQPVKNIVLVHGAFADGSS